MEKKRPLTRAKKGPNSPNVLQTIIFFGQDDWGPGPQQFCSVIIFCSPKIHPSICIIQNHGVVKKISSGPLDIQGGQEKIRRPQTRAKMSSCTLNWLQTIILTVQHCWGPGPQSSWPKKIIVCNTLGELGPEFALVWGRFFSIAFWPGGSEFHGDLFRGFHVNGNDRNRPFQIAAFPFHHLKG